MGSPSESIWDRDRLTVRFQELLPDETIEESSERIDNLTRSRHAARILERHRDQSSSEVHQWSRALGAEKAVVPPPPVRPGSRGTSQPDQRTRQGDRGRLAALDESAASWSSGPTPDWLCGVRTESSAVMSTPKFLEARRFTSVTGNREVFALHASFGKGGRIHLRVDAARRQVEIGYIGGHLPTKKLIHRLAEYGANPIRPAAEHGSPKVL